MEKISVIIPTYNREATIYRAVISVLNQTYSDLEVLVVDDGSTDATESVVAQIEDSRLKYIPLKANGGVSHARNVGAGLARGEWIAFQDSDDCWYRDKLTKQMEYAKEHPEYGMIYGFYQANLEDGKQLRVPVEPLPDRMEGWLLDTLLVKNIIGAPTVLVKKACFMEIGGFDTTYQSLEDWEFVLRFAEKYQMGCVPEVLMDVFMQQDGISSKAGAYFESRCRIVAAYKHQMARAGVLEKVVLDILNRAQEAGILDPVQRLLELYLQ